VNFRLVCPWLAPLRRALPKTATSEIPDREAAQRCSFNLRSEYSEVTKLYVGNLPFTATEEAVRALFAAHGTVEKVSLITDRDTGRARGFGFVEMSNADASRAMQTLNGTDFEGRSLKINEAQDRDRSSGGRGPRRY
jgi:RNA recognition motif-containing protein